MSRVTLADMHDMIREINELAVRVGLPGTYRITKADTRTSGYNIWLDGNVLQSSLDTGKVVVWFQATRHALQAIFFMKKGIT